MTLLGRCFVRSSDCGGARVGRGRAGGLRRGGAEGKVRLGPVPGRRARQKLLSLRRPAPPALAEPPGVLFSALANTPGVRDDVFAASEPTPPTEGESLTPKAANGSTRPPVSAAVMFP